MSDVNLVKRVGFRWYWPPYLFTKVAAALAVCTLFFANFPAVEVPHAGMHNGKYGPHFERVRDFEHGWPARYAQRDSMRPVKTVPPRSPYWEETSAWTPWADVNAFDWTALILDVAFAIAAVVVATLAQWWRSRRRVLWQLRMIDLLGLITAAGLTCGWIGHARLRFLEDEKLIQAHAEQPHSFSASHYVDRDAVVPACLPASIREQYRLHFGQVVELHAGGNADLAPRFRNLLVLRYPDVDGRLRECLARLPKLEAIDLCKCGWDTSDASLRDLPPLLTLRGVNLYDSDANDGDLEWLAKCRNLERICLIDTEVTDAGLRHLSHLRRLRILDVSSEHLTDEACKTLSQISNLEELYLGGSRISDRGIHRLSRLIKLTQLTLNTPATVASVAELRKQLPACEISAHWP